MSTAGTARANGQDIYYEVHGEGEPVVLIMGIGYDSSLWHLYQVPALAREFQVIVFDNRDVGRSSRASADYTIGDMADDVAGLLAALSVERTHVIGLSMGALIAEELAVRLPMRVDRLILSGPDSFPAKQIFHPIAQWSWTKQNDASGAFFGAQQFTYLFSSSFLRNRAACDQVAHVLANNPHPVAPDAYARQARAYLQFDPSSYLGGIEAETLVVVGEQDVLTPPWVAREVATAIPSARLEIVRGDGASHVLPLERPEDFNRLAVAFLKAASPATRYAQAVAS